MVVRTRGKRLWTTSLQGDGGGVTGGSDVLGTKTVSLVVRTQRDDRLPSRESFGRGEQSQRSLWVLNPSVRRPSRHRVDPDCSWVDSVALINLQDSDDRVKRFRRTPKST